MVYTTCMSKHAGFLFFLAGACILMGIVTAEIFYPVPYSTAANMISSLGATPPPHSIIYQPSASIFDLATFLAGACIILAAVFLRKTKQSFFLATLVFGIGTLGVGIFPAYHVVDHPIAALLAFTGGGLAAIFSAKLIQGPLQLIVSVLGIIALLFLFLGLFMPSTVVVFLGKGGTERWVAYPIILWLVVFGGYLMHTSKNI